MPAPISICEKDGDPNRAEPQEHDFIFGGGSLASCSWGIPVMLAVITALALASSTSAKPQPTPLKGSLQGLFTSDDYPAEALNRDEQGTVKFLLRIDRTGAIAACVIKETSGWDALDKRTCDVIRHRAQFKPARDRRGRAVASTLTQTIEWRVDEGQLPSEPWVSRSILILAADRRPMSCRFEYEGALTTPDASSQSCSLEGVNPDATILHDIPDGMDIVSERRFELGAGPGTGALRPGEIVIDRTVFNLKIDAFGKVQSCTVITATATDAERSAAELHDPCSTLQKSCKPRIGPTGELTAFDATLTMLEYARPRMAATH